MKEDENQVGPTHSPSFHSSEERRLFEVIQIGQKTDATEEEKERAKEAIMEIASLYRIYASGVAKKEFYYLDESTQKDLVQESFFTIERLAATFDPNRGVQFSTYIYPYLKKTYQNFLKSSDPTSANIEEIRSEEEEIYEEEDLPELSELLVVLTPRQKEAIGYRYGVFGQEKKKTYKEIGKAMGISAEAARVLVTIGIGKMHNIAGGKK